MTDSNLETRSLQASDLDPVVDIDHRIVGRSRQGFFEKRLEAAIKAPEDFVAVGVEDGGRLVGYAFTRIHVGDFGTEGKVAVLDTIGVDPDIHAKGIGRIIMEALENRLRKKEVTEIRTQSDWRYPGLIQFFAAMNFEIAPANVLECSTEIDH